MPGGILAGVIGHILLSNVTEHVKNSIVTFVCHLYKSYFKPVNRIKTSAQTQIHTKYKTTFWQNSDKSQKVRKVRSMFPLLKIVCRVVSSMNTYDFALGKTTPCVYTAIPGFNPLETGPL